MAKIITIYCEGKRGSHDFDILEKTVEGLSVSIQPIGGKKGANAIIEHREHPGTAGATLSDFYLLFRDRDFDCLVPSEEKLFFDGKKAYYSYRTTIENYLFDIPLFYQFVEKKQGKWNIHSEDDAKKLFIEVAKELRYYQAVRHTLGELRSSNSFSTTWVDGSSGQLPQELDLEHCKQNGWMLIRDVVSKCNEEWTEAKFNAKLNEYLERFDDQFFDDLKFLVYYQGKDFAKSLTKRLPSFPLKDYYKFVKDSFEYKKYGDLVELRALIESNK